MPVAARLRRDDELHQAARTRAQLVARDSSTGVDLYDACVLYPAPLRDLLIRLANTGVVRARWSATILDECFRNILENRPDLKPESLERTRELMTQAVPDCMVTNFEGLIDALVLPDVDDRHVLAAAIRLVRRRS